MTDEKLMKVLACCANDDCSNCPTQVKQCRQHAMLNALDLINRQKAEIEMLENYIENIRCANADILDNHEISIKEARAEAIKEFAERLVAIYENDKTYDRPNAHTLVKTLFCNIDNLAKEMTGRN